MSFLTFKSEWLGKRVDTDGVYLYQCVDLIRQYLAEERGLAKTGAWGNAIDYWYRPAPQVLAVCSKIGGSYDASTGDIVVLETNKVPIVKGSGEGHIGIATGNITDSQVEILEQNGATGSGDGLGGNAIRTRYVARSRVAGLLRLKPINTPQGGSNVILTQDDAQTLYRRLFNRDGDPGGLKNYTGKTLDFALGDMLSSQEFKSLHTVVETAPMPDPAVQVKANKYDQIKSALS